MSESQPSASRTLSEHDSKKRLAAFGIPMAPEHLVETADQAAEAARQLGGAVVVKLCGDHIAHKTERNLVRVGIADPEGARAAAAELLAAARPEDGEVAAYKATRLKKTCTPLPLRNQPVYMSLTLFTLSHDRPQHTHKCGQRDGKNRTKNYPLGPKNGFAFVRIRN